MNRLFPLLAFAALSLTGCDGGGSYVEPQGPVTPPTTGDRVVINGVTWATCNVGEPGAFVGKPEDFGMLYQWGRKTGWSASDPLVSLPEGGDWNYNGPSIDSWMAENDPCPEGWRVPTYKEVESLIGTAGVTTTWGTLNDVKGRSFTDKATGNSIFFPASHGRHHDGSLNPTAVGAFVQYWTTSAHPEYPGNFYTLCFESFEADPLYYSSMDCGFSVRCVVK